MKLFSSLYHIISGLLKQSTFLKSWAKSPNKDKNASPGKETKKIKS